MRRAFLDVAPTWLLLCMIEFKPVLKALVVHCVYSQLFKGVPVPIQGCL